MAGPHFSQELLVSKLTSPLRNLALLASLVLLTAGCGKDSALPWHFWIAPVLAISAVGLLFFGMPLTYYLKVWRLKHRGR